MRIKIIDSLKADEQINVDTIVGNHEQGVGFWTDTHGDSFLMVYNKFHEQLIPYMIMVEELSEHESMIDQATVLQDIWLPSLKRIKAILEEIIEFEVLNRLDKLDKLTE